MKKSLIVAYITLMAALLGTGTASAASAVQPMNRQSFMGILLCMLIGFPPIFYQMILFYLLL